MNTSVGLFLTILILASCSIAALFALELRTKPEVVDERRPSGEITVEAVDPQLPTELKPTRVEPMSFRKSEGLIAVLEKQLLAEKRSELSPDFGFLTADRAEIELLNAFRAKALDGETGLHIRELGEVSSRREERWELRSEGEESLVLDLIKGDDGWTLEGLRRGEDVIAAADALSICRSFLEAVLDQDFETALSYVSEDGVPYERLVGLCIVMEEAGFVLPDRNALRSLFSSEFRAGFYATIVDPGTANTAKLGVVLEADGADGEWRVRELNLDALLSQYTENVAEGDSWYTPVVTSPSAGDSLVIYFDFDAGRLSERTQRQLDIVAALLLADSDKRLKISGHTDAVGTDDYNLELSRERAIAVESYLREAGVDADQMEVEALGATQPRQPNEDADGGDNPLGRRANRRTEILLSF